MVRRKGSPALSRSAPSVNRPAHHDQRCLGQQRRLPFHRGSAQLPWPRGSTEIPPQGGSFDQPRRRMERHHRGASEATDRHRPARYSDMGSPSHGRKARGVRSQASLEIIESVRTRCRRKRIAAPPSRSPGNAKCHRAPTGTHHPDEDAELCKGRSLQAPGQQVEPTPVVGPSPGDL